jgi:hypothetical protein
MMLEDKLLDYSEIVRPDPLTVAKEIGSSQYLHSPSGVRT